MDFSDQGPRQRFAKERTGDRIQPCLEAAEFADHLPHARRLGKVSAITFRQPTDQFGNLGQSRQTAALSRQDDGLRLKGRTTLTGIILEQTLDFPLARIGKSFRVCHQQTVQTSKRKEALIVPRHRMKTIPTPLRFGPDEENMCEVIVNAQKGDSQGDSQGDSACDSDAESAADFSADSAADSATDSATDSEGDFFPDSGGNSGNDSKGASESDSDGDLVQMSRYQLESIRPLQVVWNPQESKHHESRENADCEEPRHGMKVQLGAAKYRTPTCQVAESGLERLAIPIQQPQPPQRRQVTAPAEADLVERERRHGRPRNSTVFKSNQERSVAASGGNSFVLYAGISGSYRVT